MRLMIIIILTAILSGCASHTSFPSQKNGNLNVLDSGLMKHLKELRGGMTVQEVEARMGKGSMILDAHHEIDTIDYLWMGETCAVELAFRQGRLVSSKKGHFTHEKESADAKSELAGTSL